MARNVFFSFHFDNDCWRASQVRNMSVIDGNHPVRDNEWEEIKKGGNKAIEKWIDEQMDGKSCAVVLVGSETYKRPWVIHEISHAWNLNKGVVGICVHNLLNVNKNQSSKGLNPFDKVILKNSGKKLSEVATLYNPPYTGSTDVYADIKAKISGLVEDAIKIRKNN